MNRHFLIFAVVCGFLLLTSAISSPSQAMNLSESLLTDNVLIIKLDGEIVRGDSNRVQTFIENANRRTMRKIVVLINSRGGIVTEAANIANFIFQNKLPVAVPHDCASACFLIFAAGSVKLVGPSSRIGVHSVRNVDKGETDDAMALSVLMSRELRRYGVPADVIGQLVTTDPDQIYWLTNADLMTMGANIAK